MRRCPAAGGPFVRTLQAGVGLFGARNCEETAQAARSLDQPVLVAWGRQDRVFPSENAERALTLLPAGKLCLIDRCGHYPHWEQPEIFAHASLEFLS
jgi:pimeloyl-ACP methyl ester carboxylesterase